MEEKKYAIYSFSASWDQIAIKNNGTSHSKMYKEDPTVEQLNEELNNMKIQLEKKYAEEGNDIIKWHNIKYEYKEHEAWCSGWFNHYTYNLFDKDADVRKSFHEFIDRKKQLNRENGHGYTEMHDFDNRNPFYCFMGAEETYRWNICRCEHCTKVGKITIDH